MNSNQLNSFYKNHLNHLANDSFELFSEPTNTDDKINHPHPIDKNKTKTKNIANDTNNINSLTNKSVDMVYTEPAENFDIKDHTKLKSTSMSIKKDQDQRLGYNANVNDYEKNNTQDLDHLINAQKSIVTAKLSIKKSERIVKNTEYCYVLNSGQKYISKLFVMIAVSSSQRSMGIIVSKKVAKGVKRNLLKRRIREIYRQVPGYLVSSKSQLWQKGSYPQMKFVVIARKSAVNSNYQRLTADFLYCLTQLSNTLSRQDNNSLLTNGCG